MKRLIVLLFSFSVSTFIFPLLAQVPGDPDPTFGTQGFHIRSVGTGNAFGRATTIQPDGKILVACVTHNGTDNDFGLLRFTAEGKVDSTFGQGGLVTFDFASSTEIIEAVMVDHANRIIIAGSVDTGDGFAFAAVRFTAEGLVDPTFGVLGFVLAKAWTTGFCTSMLIQEDHKIVLGGYAFNPLTNTNEFTMARFLESGLKDASFGQQGFVMTHLGIGAGVANAMMLQPDGKIVQAGQALNNNTFLWEAVLVRYQTDGQPDPAWGDAGFVFQSFPGKNFTINTLALDSNKNIVTAGFLGTAPSDNLYTVLRFQNDGSPDISFGNAGLVINSFGAEDNQIHDLEIQPDGHILIAGTSLASNADRFALARLNPQGDPDLTFGQDGVVITTVGLNDGIESTALQSDGKWIVAGESFNGTRFQLVVGRYITGITTGTHDEEPQADALSVFPNPAMDYFTVSISDLEERPNSIDVFDMSGRHVQRFEAHHEIEEGRYMEPFLLPAGCPPGIYHLSILIGTKVIGTRILIQP